MNYVIGLCRHDAGWPSSLAELGYEVQVIEQTIGTARGDRVKPDIIAASNKHLHALVLECKGGASIDKQQVDRYSGPNADDLTRWVTVYSPSQLQFDVGFPIFQYNEKALLEPTYPYPLIAFGRNAIDKIRNFSREALNVIFPIGLDGMTPPLNYYPFSDQDKDAVIVPRVLRMIVQVALANARGGASSLDQTIYTEDVVSQMHPYWNALSTEHRNALVERIKKIVKHLLDSQPTLRMSLEELEGKSGYKTLAPLKTLRKTAEEIAIKMETQETITKYLP
jgi:hypothetical protein